MIAWPMLEDVENATANLDLHPRLHNELAEIANNQPTAAAIYGIRGGGADDTAGWLDWADDLSAGTPRARHLVLPWGRSLCSQTIPLDLSGKLVLLRGHGCDDYDGSTPPTRGSVLNITAVGNGIEAHGAGTGNEFVASVGAIFFADFLLDGGDPTTNSIRYCLNGFDLKSFRHAGFSNVRVIRCEEAAYHAWRASAGGSSVGLNLHGDGMYAESCGNGLTTDETAGKVFLWLRNFQCRNLRGAPVRGALQGSINGGFWGAAKYADLNGDVVGLTGQGADLAIRDVSMENIQGHTAIVVSGYQNVSLENLSDVNSSGVDSRRSSVDVDTTNYVTAQQLHGSGAQQLGDYCLVRAHPNGRQVHLDDAASIATFGAKWIGATLGDAVLGNGSVETTRLNVTQGVVGQGQVLYVEDSSAEYFTILSWNGGTNTATATFRNPHASGATVYDAGGASVNTVGTGALNQPISATTTTSVTAGSNRTFQVNLASGALQVGQQHVFSDGASTETITLSGWVPATKTATATFANSHAAGKTLFNVGTFSVTLGASVSGTGLAESFTLTIAAGTIQSGQTLYLDDGSPEFVTLLTWDGDTGAATAVFAHAHSPGANVRQTLILVGGSHVHVGKKLLVDPAATSTTGEIVTVLAWDATLRALYAAFLFSHNSGVAVQSCRLTTLVEAISVGANVLTPHANTHVDDIQTDDVLHVIDGASSERITVSGRHRAASRYKTPNAAIRFTLAGSNPAAWAAPMALIIDPDLNLDVARAVLSVDIDAYGRAILNLDGALSASHNIGFRVIRKSFDAVAAFGHSAGSVVGYAYCHRYMRDDAAVGQNVNEAATTRKAPLTLEADRFNSGVGNGYLRLLELQPGMWAIAIFNQGDANPRLLILSDGSIRMGNGTLGVDVQFRRDGPNGFSTPQSLKATRLEIGGTTAFTFQQVTIGDFTDADGNVLAAGWGATSTRTVEPSSLPDHGIVTITPNGGSYAIDPVFTVGLNADRAWDVIPIVRAQMYPQPSITPVPPAVPKGVVVDTIRVTKTQATFRCSGYTPQDGVPVSIAWVAL